MKISLNKNIKDSNKNFTNFEEKKGEFLKLTYKSFLTNEKRYNSNNMYIYKNTYNMIILYYYPILLIPLFCLVLIPNFDELLDNLLKKILLVCPQNPYIEVTLFFIYFILFCTLPYLIILLILKNYYKKTNFTTSKDGISLKTQKSEIFFKKDDISEFYIDKEINQLDKIPFKYIFKFYRRGISVEFQEIKQESICIIIVLKNFVILPIYGIPMNEFVLFTNLSEEDAKYLVNSMNYVLGLMNQVS